MNRTATARALTYEDDEVVDAADAGRSAAREESRAALATLLELVGYPEGWAEDLERRAFAAGKLWKQTA